MTDAERLLWRHLRLGQLGWRFRRQYPIPPYIADFACIEAKVIVEVDGGQHAAPGADAQRAAYLRRHNWRVLRFWNNEVLQNLAGVLAVILEAVGQCSAQRPHPNPPPHAGEGENHAAGAASFPPPLAGEG